MKVLITGATGLVGKAIVEELQRRDGYRVHYLTTKKNKIVSQENMQGFLWAPDKGEIDLKCFEGVDAIINLAGATISKRWTPSYKKVILSSRVQSLSTLRKGLQKVGTKSITSFVSASAIGIYPHSLTNLYAEDEKKVDNSFLGEVVEVWEKEIDTFRDFSFNTTAIRIGLVLSEKGGALPKMAKPIKNFMGAAFGTGEQWQSWIHIEDLAKMFIFVIENQLQGIYNGVAPNPVTNLKLTKSLAEVFNRPLILPNIPKFVMKAILGEMSYLLFVSNRVSSKRIEKKGFVFDHTNIGCSLKALYHKNTGDNTKTSTYVKEYI